MVLNICIKFGEDWAKDLEVKERRQAIYQVISVNQGPLLLSYYSDSVN